MDQCIYLIGFAADFRIFVNTILQKAHNTHKNRHIILVHTFISQINHLQIYHKNKKLCTPRRIGNTELFITELTPEIMHELIEKIVVHAHDKSSGHRTQQIDIYYRFDVAVSTAVADSMKYDKKRKVA